MPRPYYIFSSGRLRRRQNTLYLERPSESALAAQTEEEEDATPEISPLDTVTESEDLGDPLSVPSLANDDPPPESAPLDATPALPSAPPKESPTTAPEAGPERPRIIPIEDVEELYLFGELTLNTRLLNFLGQHGIPVHTFNYYGHYTGTYYPRERNVSGHLLVRQVEHYLDPAKRLALAKAIVRGAAHNLHRNLVYYRNRGKDVQESLALLEHEAAQAQAADSIPALMGAEGRLRDAYYRAFNTILALETPFLKRVKRPPDNLVNTLLSFGNSLLYPTILAQIYRTPLNPTISYLHEPSARRFSLALDLAEIFKPLLVDKLIFTLINKQMITEDDLETTVGFAYLTERARKLMVQEFDTRLRTTVKHRRLGRSVSYRGFIRLECYKLVRHLLDMEPYQALRAWW